MDQYSSCTIQISLYCIMLPIIDYKSQAIVQNYRTVQNSVDLKARKFSEKTVCTKLYTIFPNFFWLTLKKVWNQPQILLTERNFELQNFFIIDIQPIKPAYSDSESSFCRLMGIRTTAS